MWRQNKFKNLRTCHEEAYVSCHCRLCYQDCQMYTSTAMLRNATVWSLFYSSVPHSDKRVSTGMYLYAIFKNMFFLVHWFLFFLNPCHSNPLSLQICRSCPGPGQWLSVTFVSLGLALMLSWKSKMWQSCN